MNSNTITWIT